MREQNASTAGMPTRSTTWLSANQPGRTSTGTYAGIPDDTSHSTTIVRRSPTHVQPYRRDMQVHVHNGPPPAHIQRRARVQAPTTNQPYYYEDYEEEEQIQPRPKRKDFRLRRFIIVFCFLGLFLSVVYGIYIICNIVTAWGHDTYNQATYGYPRTYQIDRNVGHGGISHFTVENLNGHIYVIEISGDAKQSHLYVGPTVLGDGADKEPATVTFATVNGVIDMVIRVGGDQQTWVNNSDGTFHPGAS